MASTTQVLQVTERRNLAPDVIELKFKAEDGTPLAAWEPGSHIDLRLADGLIRQYSLVEPVTGQDGTWTIAVLVEQLGRGGSRFIDRNLKEGTTVKTSGVRNHFEMSPGSKYLFIGGGIGITPLIAQFRKAIASGASARLIYCGRERARMAYLTDLETEFPGLVEVFDLSEGQLLDVAGTIDSLDADTQVYCCGPDSLMDAVEIAMSTSDRLPYMHLERFTPRNPADFNDNFEFEVFAATSDIEFTVPDDESILVAADFEGILVPGDCLEGTCGSCETRVIEGEVEHRDTILSAAQQATNEVMMICVSRAAPGCKRLVLDL